MFIDFRYIAVHFPLKRLNLHTNKRTLKYILSVLLLSLVFTVTKFFEVETFSMEHFKENATITDNNTTMVLKQTDLRLHPMYVKYYNWSRLMVHGLVPFVMLVYLNGLIYQDIKSRRKEWENKETYDNEIETTDTVELKENGVYNFQDSKKKTEKDSREVYDANTKR